MLARAPGAYDAIACYLVVARRIRYGDSKCNSRYLWFYDCS